jgi:hypothetical protein
MSTGTKELDRTDVGEREFSVRQLADSWQVKQHVILALIKAAELKAIDRRAPGSIRPRWRIKPSEVLAFDERRANRASPKPGRPRKKKRPAVNLIDPATGKIRREFRATGSSNTAAPRKEGA